MGGRFDGERGRSGQKRQKKNTRRKGIPKYGTRKIFNILFEKKKKNSFSRHPTPVLQTRVAALLYEKYVKRSRAAARNDRRTVSRRRRVSIATETTRRSAGISAFTPSQFYPYPYRTVSYSTFLKAYREKNRSHTSITWCLFVFVQRSNCHGSL